jgi:hypothetical protein
MAWTKLFDLLASRACPLDFEELTMSTDKSLEERALKAAVGIVRILRKRDVRIISITEPVEFVSEQLILFVKEEISRAIQDFNEAMAIKYPKVQFPPRDSNKCLACKGYHSQGIACPVWTVEGNGNAQEKA